MKNIPALPALPDSEYVTRRRRLLTSLKNAVGLILAGEAGNHLTLPWRPHAHFEYLTGLSDEPGAALLLDPTNPVESRRIMLFLRPLDPEIDQWNGLRLPIGHELKTSTGFQTIHRSTSLARFLSEAARRSKALACLHPLAVHTAPVSPDLEIFRRVAERIPGVAIIDRTDLVPLMRAVKSAREVSLIRRAAEITAAGFDAAIRFIRPGINEFDVQETLEHAYKTHGARATAFQTIAGSGINSTVLHYHANNRMLESGDLICIDSGAAYMGYAADVTRTVPVSGRFTPRQREIYSVVLKANEAAIAAAKPGVTLSSIDTVARRIIKNAGFGDYFLHSIGHHLGLETHDASPDASLRDGAVITIEPGIYIPSENIGIRIEDDVVISKSRSVVLTAAVPKQPDEIERIMSRNRASSSPDRLSNSRLGKKATKSPGR